jgi:hypothetical protein
MAVRVLCSVDWWVTSQGEKREGSTWRLNIERLDMEAARLKLQSKRLNMDD